MRQLQQPPRRVRRRAAQAAFVVTMVTCSALVVAGPAQAAPPALRTTGTSPEVGALPVDPAVGNPPQLAFPPAPKQSGGCTFPNVPGPEGIVVKHVAPCGSSAGNGSASSPWRTIAQAMAALGPNQAAYLHDDAALVNDYAESDLRPANGGTGANSRIWLIAAPGESPQITRSPASAAATQSIFRLTRPWWVLDGLRIDAAGLAFTVDVVRVGDGLLSTPAEYIVIRRLTTRNGRVPKGLVAFDAARNSALLDSINPANAGDPNVGLGEILDANGRPAQVPVDDSDHHGITAKNGSDRILVRNNNSFGHNGDSFQCGEESSSTAALTTNVTIENNRFHQDEENAVDIKACHGVTIRGNKFFGYRPARPLTTARSSQGDAVVVHRAGSGRTADRVLIELNRLWDNSRAVNVDGVAPRAVIRRNLVFNASTAFCGMGAGFTIRSRTTEVYHNTLDRLTPQGAAPTGCPEWGVSEEAALRLAPNSGSGATAVLWNNIVSNATNPYRQGTGFALDARRNLFNQNFTGIPADSIVGDPRYVVDPASNDYFTQQGSPARDAATPVPSTVADPRTYCDDPSPAEPDITIEPDVGFLESCT
jgi:hypothetical protein